MAKPVVEENEEDEDDGTDAGQTSDDPVGAMLADDAAEKVEELSKGGPHHATDARMWRNVGFYQTFVMNVCVVLPHKNGVCLQGRNLRRPACLYQYSIQTGRGNGTVLSLHFAGLPVAECVKHMTNLFHWIPKLKGGAVTVQPLTADNSMHC